MSSLKHIMDTDVEPLDSQAYRKAREATQQPASLPPIDRLSATPTPSPTLDDTKGNTSNSRRRSNRVSKAGGQSSPSRPSSFRRRSSTAAEAMDYNTGYQMGGSNQASNAGSPQQSSSMGSDLTPTGDVPVKYTPVTGRISRAKKGVPVHTCMFNPKSDENLGLFKPWNKHH